MASVEDVEQRLTEDGFSIQNKGRMRDDRGYRLDLNGGAIVNVYDTGKVQLQGKQDEKLKELVKTMDGKAGAKNSSRQVFVVYGHDTTAKTELEAMLRRWQLEPIILDQLPSEGATIIEKLQKFQGNACYGVVLVTPDDEGHRKNHPDEKKFRARQNIVLELGMLLSKLGRPRVAILMDTSEDMERPSDIHGLVYIPFKDSVEEAKTMLAKEMGTQGINIEISRL